MPESWLDTLLLSGLAILIEGIAFVSAVEGWRRWSEHRRLRKHFRMGAPIGVRPMAARKIKRLEKNEPDEFV